MGVIWLETFIEATAERCFDLSLGVKLHLESTSRTGERVISGRQTSISGDRSERYLSSASSAS